MAEEQDDKMLQEELIQLMRRIRKARLNVLSEQMIYTEYFALEQISRYGKTHPDSPGIYVSELASSMNIVPPAASRLLNSLEGKGFITRKADPGDRRNTFVCLTPAGMEILAQTAKDMDALKDRLAVRMGRENLITLIELWTKLADIMEEEMSAYIERRRRPADRVESPPHVRSADRVESPPHIRSADRRKKEEQR